MTDDALAMVQKAIDAVNPYQAVQTHLLKGNGQDVASLSVEDQIYRASEFESVLLISFGKASSAMAVSTIHRLEQAFPKLPIYGVVVVKDNHTSEEEIQTLRQYPDIRLMEASHPVPDDRSVEAGRNIMRLAHEASPQTLVICCISGGGSSLFCTPTEPLSLHDLIVTNEVLLKSGMPIRAMNVIRKRLEAGKGGGLAAAAYPAKLLTLVLSDILGDPLDLIASGPTFPDPTTFQDAMRIVQENQLLLPDSVMKLLHHGLVNSVTNCNPTDNDSVFQNCKTILVGNNELAVIAAADEASSRGYNPVIIGTRVEGEARDVAGVYVAMAHQLQHGGTKYGLAKLPAALISGGETTVTLTNHDGKGGRNQELALVAAQQLHSLKLRNVVLASVGTDGTDGPTDAAGAVVDGATVDRMKGSVADALSRHDAYTYLDQFDDDGHKPLIRTGATGTNVAEIGRASCRERV